MTPKLLEAMKARIERLLETKLLCGHGGLCGYISHSFTYSEEYRENEWGDVYEYVNNFVSEHGHLAEDECYIRPIGIFTREREQAAQDLLTHIEKELKDVEAITEGR